MPEASKTALEKARAALTKLLDRMELTEVVLVDDEVLVVKEALAKRLPCLSKEAFRATLADSDTPVEADAYAKWKAGRFKELIRTDPDLLARERRELIASDPSQVDGPIEVLAYMCQARFRPLTPEQWTRLDTSEREEIAAGSLVLFDRELGGGFDSGDAMLAEFLDEFPDAYPAILTNVVDFGKEIEEALADAAAGPSGKPSDPARSLIASKQRLTTAAPVNFVEDLRITAAAPRLGSARDALLKVAVRAHERAVLDVQNTIDLRTLEHIVVRAARTEGSWEADALLRVLAIIYRDHAQQLLLAPEELGKMGEIFAELRKVFAQDGAPDTVAREKAGELMQRERYDPGSLINAAGLPLACGDVFRIGGEEGGLWMLLDQPCDLQLRDARNSRERIASTDLLKVVVLEKGRGRTYELPSGSRQCSPDDTLFLTLNTRLTATFDVLELCVFDSGGACRIDTSLTEPPIVPQTPAIGVRWGELLAVHRELAHLAGLADDDAVRDRVLGLAGTLQGAILEWPIVRVERLNEPHAQMALRAVSDDRSRFAFDPDLTAG